ncbi:LysM peptidoglycan-binding domain-containing protein [Aciduricibacillus chroicocephali]|uniref:LysM peptidoglycan-binding domain-containing protein n=1 Tax=Aciduricibacillus chroicocephali TaxID=3054939 RepID=A0ABY9KVL4_9BACI|nr:LysM peptidoglycan-binding domain-containing protein [Bacillaceae bacterium 44XB]
MKKMVAAVATGIVITGTAATSVSAADYQVKAGDTLWNIAQTHNTSVDSIIKNNGLKGTIIYPNQTLSVGGGSSNTQVAQNNGSYTVKSGDTLFKIAKANGVSVGTLKQWNNLSGDLIVVGQKLSLSGQVQQPAQAQPQQAPVQQSASQQQAPVQKQQAPVQKQQAPAQTQQAQPQAKQTSNPQGKQITVQSTAYTADCAGCSGVTATGVNLKANRNAKVIAVDPSVIPLGSKVYVPGYGTAIAADTGGAIKGNRIDVHVPSKSQAYNWGRKSVTVTVVQ